MTDKIKEIIKLNDIVIPRLLFNNYKKINLSSDEFVFLIYVLNNTMVFNPKKISTDMSIPLNDVMDMVENLTNKGILKLELKKVGNVRNEYINLDGLYSKLTFSFLNEQKEEVNTSIYDLFEREFGRTISPMEYQIIGAWLDSGTSEEIITLALKEAIYNGVSNLRYIDKIISEWKKKGIKNKCDVEQARVKHKNVTKVDNQILEYDWLNDA